MSVWRLCLLQASHAAAIVTPLDFLHIPKTGGSFGFPLTVYNCDTHIVNHHYNASTVSSLFYKWNHRSALLKDCKDVPVYVHAPMGRDPDFGHGHYKTEAVVTILRSPKSRIASGFKYHLHSCSRQVVPAMKQAKTKNTLFLEKFSTKPQVGTNLPRRSEWRLSKIACSWLASEREDLRSAAEQAVLAYHRCQAGCSERMLAGHVCPRWKAHLDDNVDIAAQRLMRAKNTLKRLAFVGLTGNWSQSMCLFTKLFPRKSGQSYPVAVNDNQKPSSPKSLDCAHLVEKVLTKHGVLDPDDEIYTLGQELFEKQLEKYPECRNA